MSRTQTLMAQLSAHVKHGDHICVVCENADDRLHAAAQYIADGLRRNEFVMYAADPATTQTLRTMLASEGIDVDGEMARGALNLPTPYEAYLRGGGFDPDVMYAAFEDAIAGALAAGFSGCRFAGEPVWALDRVDLRPGLIEFEARLNGLFRDKKAAGLCVYDKNAWPADVVRDILCTHPVAVVDDLVCKSNVYYEQGGLAEQEATAARQVDRMLSHLRGLRLHETRLEVALEAGRLGTWEFDLHGDTSACSVRHNEIFGYEHAPARWGYAELLAHVLPEDRGQVRQAFDIALDGDGTFRVECRIRRHGDGAVRWIDMHGRGDPPGARGNRVQYLLGIIADITERKEMETALRDTDRRKDEFLATLAHELRNPLAPIFNVLQLMQLKYAGNVELQRMYGVVDRQARQLGRLVDDLLDVSRITTGRIVLRRERIDLRDALASAIEAVQPLVETARHAFAAPLPASPIWIEGDATRLAQVFLNVLSNAAKYTPAGGRIRLAVSMDGGQVQVQVDDNGIGLAPELIAKMFDMFVQGHAAGDHAQGGLGIGLSLSKQLVALHGGTIEAHSEGRGRGTRVIVRLPAIGTALETGADAPEQASRSPGRRRVLVVDDNVDAADTLAASLEFIGHDVRTCYGGTDALAMAAHWQPDVAILDIGMPGMDGYEVARALRAGMARIHLIALTGWGQENDLRKAREAGFDMHRTKPVNLAELMAAIALEAGGSSTDVRERRA